MTEQLRLNKFLAERLGLSRREADDAIAAGRVKVGGRIAKLGDRVTSTGGGAGGTPTESAGDVGEAATTGPVEFDGEIVPFETNYTYIAFHKPVGYVCSRHAQGSAPTIYDILPAKYHHLKTVGRLDKDSSGLILLTNDGDFAFQHTHPKFAKEKIYEVELNKPLEPLHQQMISDYGVMLDDGPSRFLVARAEETDGPRYVVVLKEGRNRQIRRTFAALGYRVVKLHRTQFGVYQLGSLKEGESQEFTPTQPKML